MEPFGNCRTTAMGIMPHRDIDRALALALKMDIPFWPQLPNVSYYEDMYAQGSEHFPGLTIDVAAEKVYFDSNRFLEELGAYAETCDVEDTFALSPAYSVVYHRFLQMDLAKYPAIRGQVIGPVSFGFRVVDENLRPLIYNEDARTLLFDYIQKKINHQYREMQEKNPHAFVWLDEPGLGWVFSALSGFSDEATKEAYAVFLAGLEGPRALHLCADINLPYLLGLGFDIVSFDSYQVGNMPGEYARAVGEFLNKGGTISWGIVPIDPVSIESETPSSLAEKLGVNWTKIAAQGSVTVEQIASQSMLAPARCCLKAAGKVGGVDDAKETSAGSCAVSSTAEEYLVERAFGYLADLSAILKKKYRLS